jgi:arylsulfatase A-like enzyme
MPWGGGAGGGPLGTTPSTNPNANRWRGNFPNTPFEGSMRVPAIIRWPGAVPAAVLTNEMLSAVDRLPTLAVEIRAQGSADRRRRRLGLHARHEPYERPRQLHVLRPDGELMSIKWKGLQDDLPLHGDSNLSYRDLTCGWMLAPAFKLIGAPVSERPHSSGHDQS